jgi:hypothetical protein
VTTNEQAISWTPSPEAARLVPVLNRAIELGHGPPALMRWLSGRVDGARPAAGTVTRLAAELTRAVRRAGVTETLAE